MKLNKKILAITSICILGGLYISYAVYCKNNKAVPTSTAKVKKIHVATAKSSKQKISWAPSKDKIESLVKKSVPSNTQNVANNTSSSLAQGDKTAQATTDTQQDLLVEKIKGIGNSEQAVVVTTSSFENVLANIQLFEKDNGQWKQISSQFSGDVGMHGFTWNKVEGDGKTPIGKFSFGTGFGKDANPGTQIEYRQVNNNDYWVDDSNSSLYNTWQAGPANGRWSSGEKLLRSDWLYDYAVAINYNTEKARGKGSAIFLHIWRGPGSGTAGCVATSQDNLLKIIRWLNPAKNPVIIQGPMSEILKM